MKLNEAPAGGFGQPGVNQMFMKDWTVVENEYNGTPTKQLQFEFVLEPDSDKVKKVWVPFSKEFEDKDAWKFIAKLEQFKRVLASYVGQEAADERFKVVKDKLFAEDLDNNDLAAVHRFQERFVTALFKVFPENYKTLPIEVIMHYKGEYLNIPSPKENGYEIPFGMYAPMGSGLNLRKGGSAQAHSNGHDTEASETESEVGVPTTTEDQDW